MTVSSSSVRRRRRAAVRGWRWSALSCRTMNDAPLFVAAPVAQDGSGGLGCARCVGSARFGRRACGVGVGLQRPDIWLGSVTFQRVRRPAFVLECASSSESQQYSEKRQQQQPYIVPAHEAQEWALRRNILAGYRQPNRTWQRVLASLFEVHNESANIWTHLIASVAFFALSAWLYKVRLAHCEQLHRVLVSAYSSAVGITFGISSFYHTFRDNSEIAYKRLRALDFQSILFLITASYVPALAMAYAKLPFLRNLYLGIVAVLYPSIAFVVELSRRKDWSKVRNTLFCVNTLWGVIPTLHTLFAQVPYASFFVMSQWRMWACYALGFFFYASKIPERFSVFKGKACLVGHSHFIWHLLTMAGAAAHFYFLQKYCLMLAV
ncbi:ADIPOR-like receptor SPBC12C2.09c [Porphyridium purpureum]|uniref:ADIPOR-like receptor SPBC12C2.09c n=1 Tax=Porphyridium purpureum TaxID=35688 RepID=A0A5J4YPQ9_PORPP|nr:ADIPOR-like receptor SPBC12C2.09c [Porphyridium purpureum]|eukprot:POR7809..scf295_9